MKIKSCSGSMEEIGAVIKGDVCANMLLDNICVILKTMFKQFICTINIFTRTVWDNEGISAKSNDIAEIHCYLVLRV